MKAKIKLIWKRWDELSDKEKRSWFIPPNHNPKDGRYAYDESGKGIKATFPFPMFK